MINKMISVHCKQLRIFMARSTGRKRFWFQQSRFDNQIQTTAEAEKSNNN